MGNSFHRFKSYLNSLNYLFHKIEQGSLTGTIDVVPGDNEVAPPFGCAGLSR